MKYSLPILKNKTFFKKHNYLYPNALKIKYFWNLSYNHWGFWDITKPSNPKLEENGMPKESLDSAQIAKENAILLIKNGGYSNTFAVLKNS